MSDAAAAAGITLTVRQAAQATGLTPKALRRRIERGSLPSTLVGDRRRVAVADLLAAGLLVSEADARPAASPGAWGLRPSGSTRDRLEHELAAERAERERLSVEVRALAARVLALERRAHGA